MISNEGITCRFGDLTDYPLVDAYDDFIGDRRLDLQAGRLVVADGGTKRACGFAVVMPSHFLGWPLLSVLCVDPCHHRTGIGLALIAMLVRHSGFVRLYTSTEQSNLAMLQLIERSGGVAVGHADKLNMSGERELLFRLK